MLHKIILPLALLTLTLAVASCGGDKGKMPNRTPKGEYYITVEKPIKTRYIGSFSRIFGDKNSKHIAAAQSVGVAPKNSREEVERDTQHFKHITTNKNYSVDSLTHSIPYLVPKAEELLSDIGEAFIDSLSQRGSGGYRVIITSVLRVENDVKRLQRRNVNAISESAHCYGTTFDMAYTRFDNYDKTYFTSNYDLKLLLSEVLKEFQDNNRCYVKYEVKQGCFHITTR